MKVSSGLYEKTLDQLATLEQIGSEGERNEIKWLYKWTVKKIFQKDLPEEFPDALSLLRVLEKNLGKATPLTIDQVTQIKPTWDPNHPLLSNGRLNMGRVLILSGYDPNWTTSKRKSPFHYGVRKNDVGLVDWLLRQKVKHSNPPLILNALYPDVSIEILRLLIQDEIKTFGSLDLARFKHNPLLVALNNWEYEKTEVLIKEGKLSLKSLDEIESSSSEEIERPISAKPIRSVHLEPVREANIVQKTKNAEEKLKNIMILAIILLISALALKKIESTRYY